MKRLLSLVALLIPLLATALAAQSLADVARKEEQRRKQLPKTAKVYTNKDLGDVPSPAPPAPAAPAGAAAAAADAPAADSAQASEKKEPTDEEKASANAASWKGKIDAARSELDRNRMFAEALQTRINSLWADFTARDDPAQRSRIETDRQKAIAELDRVKKEIETGTKGLADLEEQARRAGVPPGALR